MTSSAWKISIRGPNYFIGVVFLYFLTLSGDLLEIAVGPIDIKFSRFFGSVLLLFLLLFHRLRLIEKKLFVCFLWFLSSCVISAFFSTQFTRSLGSIGAAVFTYICFFLVPLNLMHIFDRNAILRLYLIAFACVGIHALSQLILSFFGIDDPFVTQKAGITSIARGQSWAYEPSYYALYAIPCVAYLNARYLLKSEGIVFWKVLGANLLLLISTSTGAFFSYFIFFATSFVLSLFCFVKRDFGFLRKRIVKFSMGFSLLFCGIGLIFVEIFLHTFYKFFYIGLTSHWSFNQRWQKIIEGWEAFCTSPLFGIGLRGVEKYSYLKAHYDNPDVTLYGSINAKEMFQLYTPSNVFIEMLSSLGVFGLGAFVLLGVLICQMFSAAIKNDRLPIEERKIILSLFISIIVMMICLQFNQELFRNYIWVHLGIGIGYLVSVCSKTDLKIRTPLSEEKK